MWQMEMAGCKRPVTIRATTSSSSILRWQLLFLARWRDLSFPTLFRPTLLPSSISNHRSRHVIITPKICQSTMKKVGLHWFALRFDGASSLPLNSKTPKGSWTKLSLSSTLCPDSELCSKKLKIKKNLFPPFADPR